MKKSSAITQIKYIKSSYIFKMIFSSLCSKTKLSLIIYNKKIQKKLKIDIENYKKASQRYRIIGDNGKGQEFLINTNYLIFEGEYKNGKKHGIGYEYYYNKNLALDKEYLNWEKREKNKNDYFKGNLKFEGIYYEGKKMSGKEYDNKGNLVLLMENEKGEEYYDNYNLQFEGIYKNGKRWNGIGYDYYGKKAFEIKNGEGKVKIYDRNGNLVFEGEYYNGVRNGKG